ncbi:DUF718 domain-containing protein [Aestuariivirga sp.]|uniref:DUF718 domain-containing protein n=1 Tax=Aestuariivirga sp. TaxID=2650926 RepID=UPI003919CE32
MTAYNVVRFRTKPGRAKEFIDRHLSAELNAPGFRKGVLLKTGERDFCFVGEWNEYDNLAAARPAMIGILDGMRDLLEDLGGTLGVTDPVSGPVVAEIGE